MFALHSSDVLLTEVDFVGVWLNFLRFAMSLEESSMSPIIRMLSELATWPMPFQQFSFWSQTLKVLSLKII